MHDEIDVIIHGQSTSKMNFDEFIGFNLMLYNTIFNITL